jgi:hypothetical protein
VIQTYQLILLGDITYGPMVMYKIIALFLKRLVGGGGVTSFQRLGVVNEYLVGV